MMEKTPVYLYKILSMGDWSKSQGQKLVHLPSTDADFVHLATEEQLDKILTKYWPGGSQCVVLKVETAHLPGKLTLEINPGGTNKYYHLYDGSIPLSSVVEFNFRTFSK